MGFYLQMQGRLIAILVARQVEISALDAQRHSLGLSSGCGVHVGRHVQVN